VGFTLLINLSIRASRTPNSTSLRTKSSAPKRSARKRIFLRPTYKSFSKIAATLVINALRNILKHKEFVVFVPSAGCTPLLMYELLLSTYRHSIDWKRVIVIQMDEYLEIPRNHSQSMAFYIEKYLIKPLGITQYITFFNEQGILVRKLDDYESLVEALGGIDVVVHGIGQNGHIGFNEPGSKWSSSTRVVNLCNSTIESNFGKRALFTGIFPRKAITLGIRNLIPAQHAILLLSGRGKDTIIERLFTEPPNPDIPASSLSLNDIVDIVINLQSFSPQTRTLLQNATIEN
jgi:glucosamine-6-phosphate isomerase